MKVLLVGPLYPPYTGQSVAFTIIAKSFLPKEAIIINTAKFNHNVANTIYTTFNILYTFIFYQFSTIYFTSSRSKLGILKEIPLLLLGHWNNKKIVNHLHGADFSNFYNNSTLLKPLIKYIYDKINTSIVLLDEMKDQYIDFPRMKIEAIHNCYSEKLDQTLPQFDKKMQLLYLSNLMRSKGILEFLDACEYLLNKYPLLEVKLAGSPLSDTFMDRKTITSEFHKKYNYLKDCFNERICYIGVVDGPAKINLLFESSIFVLPTYYPTEAFPISIIEAMRTGNAIITTNHNYLSHIINPNNGIIIEPRSTEAIIKGVEILLTDQQKLKEIQMYNIKQSQKKYTQARYINEVKSCIGY